MPVYSARVLVSLRPSVLDPAGEATRAAANRLGVEGVAKLRIGKAVELEIEAPDLDTARERLSLLSDRLLANPVIENWTLELATDGQGQGSSSPVGEGGDGHWGSGVSRFELRSGRALGLGRLFGGADPLPLARGA